MSLPFSKFVPISASVQSPSFTVEKKHMLLAMDNALIPTSSAYLEFSGSSAVADFGAYFGKNIPEYAEVQKYFGYLSKTGTSPDKLVVARWYKKAAAPFIKGSSSVAELSALKAVSEGSFNVSFDGTEFLVVVDLSAANSYSDVATTIRNAIIANSSADEMFGNASVTYSSVTGGFIITAGETGKGHVVGAVTAGTTGTDLSAMLGLDNAVLSQGTDAETFAEFCDRLLNANSSGYSITTLEKLEQADIEAAVQWLQGSLGEQTIYSLVRLVFNFIDKETFKTVQQALIEKGYTGYVACVDLNQENVNILDCAICATIDFETANGTINFNFQPATGYTPITKLGTVVDYQQGQTNLGLAEELDGLYGSYIYSVGFGSQEQVLYGMGLMAGDFGTEDVQVNESWLEKDTQTRIMNGFIALNKLKLQGTDAKEFLSTMIAPSYEKGKTNGTIAQDGTVSEADRNSIYQAMGVAGAADSVEQNGYYFQIEDLSDEDIKLRRARVKAAYLCGGVINKVRISNTLYGA